MAPHAVGAPFQLVHEDLRGRLERRIAAGALFEVYQGGPSRDQTQSRCSPVRWSRRAPWPEM